MTEKVLRFINDNSLLKNGDSVVCGLSGGADSVCLLLIMNELSKKTGFSVEALHVNHHIRGKESDRDEDFCRLLCERLDIPFNAVSCDVPEYAKANSLSDEEAARKLRYQIFAEYSQGKIIATAHNANDNLETAVLNLVRGSGLKGLTGVPISRENIIRPLLSVTRREIEDYLNEKGQDFVTDSTNLSDEYTRNRIRHNIIPLMQEINPSIIETFINSAGTLREEEKFIASQVDKVYSACINVGSLCGLKAYEAVIRHRCIAKFLSENSLSYSRERIISVDEIVLKGGKINISGDKYLLSDSDKLALMTIPQKTAPEELSADLIIGDNTIFYGKIMSCALLNCDDLKKIENVHSLLTFSLLDYDKIVGKAVIRNRRFGDRIQLRGRNFSSSVKKLINEKIPSEQRPFLHFIADDNGIIFAERLGIADRVKVTDRTERFLKITIR